MSIKPKIMYRTQGLAGLMSKIPPSKMKQALEDAAQVVMNSVKVGFVRGISPDGTPWSKNPEWYKAMKGNARELTGPISRYLQGGKWADNWEFDKINPKRMKNSLCKTVGLKSATIRYPKDVEERARITQYGGKSKMVLMSVHNPEIKKVLNINVQARPHIGISDSYSRVPGGKTDVQLIEEAFLNIINEVVG